MHVGLLDIHSPGWTAGGVFSRVLAESLAATRKSSDNLTILHGEGRTPAGAGLDGVRTLGVPPVAGVFPGELALLAHAPGAQAVLRHKVTTLARRVVNRAVTLRDTSAAVAEAHGVDVLLPVGHYRRGTRRLAQVGWIPDFQHRHLPAFFTPEDIQLRDRVQGEMARGCARMMFSSNAALADYVRFHPGGAPGEAVPFPSVFAFHAPGADPAPVLDKYRIPRRYFLVANQLWSHKNHQVVVDALALAVSREPDLAVVMTGMPLEHRSPVNAPTSSLLQRIAEKNVRANAWLLGTVSRDELDGLLRGALALIQPSRFEGWSTSIQDARALGVPVIASNIDVHREQAPDAFGHFGCDDPATLAGQLVRAHRDLPPGPRPEGEELALAAMREQATRYGNAMWALCAAALESRRRG